MSSLRLALKQSLAETSKFAHQDDQDDQKLRDGDKRRRKHSKLAMKKRLSQKDRCRKLKGNKIKLETMNDRRGTVFTSIAVNGPYPHLPYHLQTQTQIVVVVAVMKAPIALTLIHMTLKVDILVMMRHLQMTSLSLTIHKHST